MKDDVLLPRSSGAGQVEVYLSDNIAKLTTGADAPALGGTLELFIEHTTAPIWPEGLTPLPSAELAEHIRANVGARPWDRDAIDARIVEQALAGQGAIIDSEQEVGGYPIAEPTSASFNPDEWDLATMTRR